MSTVSPVQELEQRYHRKATDRLMAVLQERNRLLFDSLEAEALQFPLMSTQVLKDWLIELKKQGKVAFRGLAPKARVPQPERGHEIVLIRSLRDE